MSAGLVAVAQLRLPMPASASGASLLHVLSPTEARIFGAVADRITFTGDPSMPRFNDTQGVPTVDTALRQLPRATAQQLRGALLLFQYGPPFAGVAFATFTSLTADDQDSYLRRWEASRCETPHLAFRAFKNLAMLGYYADDSTWSAAADFHGRDCRSDRALHHGQLGVAVQGVSQAISLRRMR